MDDDGDRRGAAGGEVGPGGSPWEPRVLSFRRYEVPWGDAGSKRSSGMRAVARKPLILRLTKDIVETYQWCNPKFKHSEALNPKRFLTTPHIGLLNEGFDNANSDLILSVNFVLVNEATQQRYIVKKMLGQGTFGQVAKCWIPETDSFVAIKVIKNQTAYYHQALHEVNILRTLNRNYDPEDKHHIVRMFEFFVYQKHLCISFEKLGSNLFELLRMNNLKGLSLTLIQMFAKQMLQALLVMKNAGIIHCDLKPENVLLCSSVKPPRVKIIDFGSACKEGNTVYSYIQSRYYRSPEVVLGYPYTTAIDMWSFGCIVAELFLGLPLFPGASEYDLLRRMMLVLGGQPPDTVLRKSKNTSKFFKHVGSIHHLDQHGGSEGHGKACAYRLLTEEECEAREKKKPVIGKWYFNSNKLSDIVNDYPLKKNLSGEELENEKMTRLKLIDFLRGLVEFNPEKRWTPLQASGHPFITGERFTGPYKPPHTTSYIPVSRQITVDHAPGQGHYLAAGLSPHVSSSGRGLRHSSPHFCTSNFTHGSNIGSYNDAPCNWGSYGSHSDGNQVYGYFSPGGRSGLSFPKHLGGSTVGTSPDARPIPHFTYAGSFGMSPTRSFGPMSLGVSPSQFTPPSSQIQVPNNSPGNYGPTSPARGSVHGSPLGRQYNRKRNLGHPVQPGTAPVPVHPGTAPVQVPEGTSPHWQSHHLDGVMSSYSEANSRGLTGPRSGSSSYQSDWTKQRGSTTSVGSSVVTFQGHLPLHPGNSGEISFPTSEASSDHAECSSSVPHPGDWDPNYSDDLLLQEAPYMENVISGIGNIHFQLMGPGASEQPQSNTYSLLMNSRTDTRSQDFSHADGGASSLQFNHPGQSHPISMPGYHTANFPPNSSSRFWQPTDRYIHVQSNLMFDGINRPNGQFPRPNYSILDSHSPANNSFGSRTSWGHQTGGNPFVSILPSPHLKR